MKFHVYNNGQEMDITFRPAYGWEVGQGYWPVPYLKPDCFIDLFSFSGRKHYMLSKPAIWMGGWGRMLGAGTSKRMWQTISW